MRVKLVGALCALALACPAAAADPLTLDVLLGLESFGRVSVDPSGRVAVFEERRARGELPRYDLQPEGALRYARLYRIDLAEPSGVRPLLPMDADAGYTIGPFSPDGQRVAIFRLQGLTWRLGIVSLNSGAVHWTEISPELAAWGRTIEWLSNDVLVAIGTSDGALPSRLERTNATQTRMPGLWAQAARGEAAYVSTGLGFPDRAPAQRTLWKIDVATGAVTALSAGPFLDLEASPDGRYVALVQDGPLLSPPDARTATEYRRARGLRMVDAATGLAIEPPETRDISTGLLSWSPTSEELLVTTLADERPRLWSIGIEGDARPVMAESFTPDVSADVFGSPTSQAGWLADRTVVRGRSGQDEGWYLNGASAPVRIEGLGVDARLVGQGSDALLFDVSGQIVRVSSDLQIQTLGRSAAISRPDGPFGQRARTSPMKAVDAVVREGADHLCRVWAAAAKPLQCVVGQPGSAVSWSEGASLGVGDSDRALNQLTLHQGGRSTVVWGLNPELDRLELAPPRLVTSPAGARGWLYLPPTTGDAPPPVVVIPYQGRDYPTPPRKARPEAIDLTQSAQLLVAAGYAVLFPDLPATDEPAVGLAQRLLAVVDAAGVGGLVDTDRIGLWGHSFGAWSSVMSAAQSSRFRAVVALNGSFNFQSVIADMPDVARMAGENDASAVGSAWWLESGQAAMLQPYWSDPERYRRNSPFEAADRITTPILLIHGELDFGPTQSEQMYAGLHRLGAPAALTLLFGEDHGVHNPGNLRLYYAQLLEWFDRYLRPDGRQDVASSDGAMPRSEPD